MTRLRLFGSPALAGADGDRPLAAERLGQLAVMLALRGDWMHREQVVALLWPELEADSGRRNLRKLLFRAHEQAWFAGLEARADAVRWAPGSDVRDFERACAAQDWAAAVDRYGGVFCEGFERDAGASFVEWLVFERQRLQAAYRAAAARRLAELAHDAPARSALAVRWLAHDPFDEDALAAAVDAARAEGRAGEALRAVDEFTHRLEREIGVAPSARVRALAAPAGGAAGGPPRGATTAAAADAGFVGRRTELLELKALAARAECRVLTITGPGGIGKSRLAGAALGELRALFDAVHWVGLEDLNDASQVAPRVASAMGLTLAPSGDPLAQIAGALQGRRVLLVFDNSEHLAGIAAVIAALLQGSAELKLLSTSRARLALPGEWLLPLAGLPVPEADETEPDVLRTFDAVRLFEVRAAAAAPAFDGADNAEEVARLVRLLDGAPLAIELAAAWVRLMPVDSIRHEIERSLDLLVGAAHAPDRHRSVRGSFEHSWRLLSAVEQAALARLSVFAAAFSREAALQVASAPLPLLAALVDRSLLRAEGDGRFSFHALMRQCAREKLELSPEATAEARRRHAEHFARLLGRLPDAGFAAREQVDAIERALEDHRAAWEQALGARQFVLLEAMAPALARFYESRGRAAEGADLFVASIASISASASSAAPDAARAPRTTLALLHRVAGTLQYWRGDLAAAEASVRSAARLYRALRNPALLGPCLQRLGLMAWTAGRVAEARRHFDDALALAQRAGNEVAAAQAVNGLAGCARALGDLEGALAQHARALHLYEKTGDVRGQAGALHDLGYVQFTLQRYADAQRTLARGLELAERHGIVTARVFCLVALGLTETELRRFDAAQDCVQRALAADEPAGHSVISSMVRLALARVATRRGDLPAARPLLRDGLAHARQMAAVPPLLVALNFIAEWFAAQAEPARAAVLWKLVAGHAQAEVGVRRDAQHALDALRLAPDADARATREAAGAELQSVVDVLAAELA